MAEGKKPIGARAMTEALTMELIRKNEAKKEEREQDAQRQIKNVVIEVERRGDKVIVPESMSYEDAIGALKRFKEQDEQVVVVSETFQCLPFEGAHAFYLALQEKFGWTSLQTAKHKGFFGEEIEEPPVMLSVPVGVDETIQVPWGQLQLPGVRGYLATGVGRNNEGRFVFTLTGEVKRKHEKLVQELGSLVRKNLREHSLYRAKAFRIRFTMVGPGGKRVPAHMPEPHFLDLSGVRPDELILSELVDSAIRTSIFTPIERAEDCRRYGIPLKRGVLLAGPFGVGKTMTAYVAAAKAKAAGWTFIYAEAADELHDALRLATEYMPAVVFCEDIDRVAEDDRRTESTERLLNILDGIDSKNTELLVVFTTNAVEEIHPAMLRPGRLDAVINISPPDAEAAEKLMRLYGRSLIAEEPLTKSRELLKGSIPAVIREAVERAKLAAIRLTPAGEPIVVTDAALTESALTMKMQRELLIPKPADERSDVEKAAEILKGALIKATPDGVAV